MGNLEELAKSIKNNLEKIQSRIEKAAVSVRRQAKDVRLIVVSKAKDITVIEAAIEAGVRDFGENYPEHAIEKIEAFRSCPGISWHMIGHLQSRKTELVVQNFNYMHSLDSVKLARKLDRLLTDSGRMLPVLLEVNVASETSKYGWDAENEKQWPVLAREAEEILALPALEVKGLMCMPPISDHAENSRKYYAKLSKLRDYLTRQFPAYQWNELSMGTSFDFEVAIQEGATFIRVGQAILGPRP